MIRRRGQTRRPDRCSVEDRGVDVTQQSDEAIDAVEAETKVEVDAGGGVAREQTAAPAAAAAATGGGVRCAVMLPRHQKNWSKRHPPLLTVSLIRICYTRSRSTYWDFAQT
mmetsp:Transcript_33396/g.71569  ORF Transcript_33396/g.71569 Transcript_33396/m.71569 type:complete len:111 (+) Transcript_33396:45-377(+)